MQKITKNIIALLTLTIFITIGYQWINTYSLWDDEANTALFAESVQLNGDTSAILNHNLIAYRNGAELDENKNARYVSPFQYYFLAPFIDINHPDPVRARLPFLLLTLFSLIIIFRRISILELSTSIYIAFSCLCLGLTSFLLYGIQCRYYALTLFFSVILAELYWFYELKKPYQYIRFGIISSLLFISNYLIGIATITSFTVHFIFVRRNSIRKILPSLLPHVFISLPVLYIWNPLGKTVVELKNTPLDKLNLLFRNVRDFNGGHLGSILILFLGVFLSSKESKKRFREYALLFLVYLAVISLFSPQPVRATGFADIRYLYPLMLLSIAWTLDFFNLILKKNKTIFIFVVIFFSFFSIPYSLEFRVHSYELVQELFHPSDDPYRLVTQELNKFPLKTGEYPTLLSSLDYATYPLMFAAPQFQYIQSVPIIAPDVLVDFCTGYLHEPLQKQFSVQYNKIASIRSSCREAYRPEVFLRNFGKNLNQGVIDIYIKSSFQNH